MTRHPLHVQASRFLVVGLFAAVVDFGSLVALMAFGVEHTPAKACSFLLGTCTAYLLNRRWTFVAGRSARRFIQVLVLYGCTFVVQVGLFAVCFPLVADWSGSFVTAQVVGFVIAQAVASVVNFLLQRLVIFRSVG